MPRRFNLGGMISTIPYYGQFAEDRIVCKLVRLPAKGVFVDVGAGDGISGSNTYHFEQKGWTGLCIDADPRQIEKLQAQRRCPVNWAAISSLQGGASLLIQAEDPTLSTLCKHGLKGEVAGTLMVPSGRLEILLDRNQIGKIDLLSIDVEGVELEAWRSMNWEKHKPTVVIIEHHTQGRPSAKKEILKEFRHYPYKLIAQTTGNLIFALDGHLKSLPKEPASLTRKPFTLSSLLEINRLFDNDPPALEALGRKHLTKDKKDAYGLLCLGMVQWRNQQVRPAIATLRALTRVVPGWAYGHYLLSYFLGHLRRFEEALREALLSWQLEPAIYAGQVSEILYGMGRWQEAEAAAWAKPGVSAKTRVIQDFAIAGKHVLVVPDAFQGGDEYLFVPMQSQNNGHIQAITWHHRRGKRHDAGLGDHIMYARYIAKLRQHGATVTMVAQPPLVSLFQRSLCVPVVEPGTVVPYFDYYIRSSRLPLAFGDTPETIPNKVPYLKADGERRKFWRKEIRQHKGLAVGLCYGGDHRITKDTFRSLPLAAFAPLAKLAHVMLFSLQIPPQSQQVKQVAFPVVDLGVRFELRGGLEDLAACMAELDLILAVDSAPAHLAGALGRPVWLLLSHLHCDYRWHLEESTSPWYPSMKILRQKKPDHWAGVIQDVGEALRVSSKGR